MSRLSSYGFSTASGDSNTAALKNLASRQNSFGSPSRASLYKKPEEVKRAANQAKGLTYPSDIGEYFITFNFKKYSRSLPLAEPKLINTDVFINLPIPTNLQEQFTMQYTDKSLGILGAVEGGLKEYMNDINYYGLDATGAGALLANKLKAGGEKLVKDPANLAYGLNKIVGAIDSSLGLGGTAVATISKATGTAANPFLAVLFQGVNLRSHSFTYRFSPNSETEHNTLKKIVHEFKIRMHPEKAGIGGIVLLYPDLVDIYLGVKDKEPYFFKTCFLTSMTLNYAPSGTPAFFSMTKDPVEVEMQLSFKEIDIVTREDFKEPINTSNVP